MDEASVKATVSDIEATGKPEVIQKSWYYAVMKPGGAIVKGETDSPAAIPELLATDHPWIQEYFNGPRGRAAKDSKARAAERAAGSAAKGATATGDKA